MFNLYQCQILLSDHLDDKPILWDIHAMSAGQLAVQMSYKKAFLLMNKMWLAIWLLVPWPTCWPGCQVWLYVNLSGFLIVLPDLVFATSLYCCIILVSSGVFVVFCLWPFFTASLLCCTALLSSCACVVFCLWFCPPPCWMFFLMFIFCFWKVIVAVVCMPVNIHCWIVPNAV